MNQAELTILDKSIENQLALLRFTAGEKRKVEKLFLQLQIELKNRLQNGLTSFGEKRVKRLLAESEKAIDAFYGRIPMEFDLKELAKTEAEATAGIFGGIGLDASLPSEAILKSLASDDLLIRGAPLKDWWSDQARSLQRKFTSQVRLGIMSNETQQQIITRVFGSKRLGTPGVGFPEGTLRRNASTLVHDMVMQISNDAALETYKANDDIIKGYYQLSTLDSHTTKTCIAYSGAEWDLEYKPIGENVLPFDGGCPRHPNCRSRILPLLKSYKELGYNIQEPPTGTRASDLGQIKADTTFDSFLKRHSESYQNDLLGKGRAQMWRDGKLSLKDLVSGNGRELTLAELKEKYLK